MNYAQLKSVVFVVNSDQCSVMECALTKNKAMLQNSQVYSNQAIDGKNVLYKAIY